MQAPNLDPQCLLLEALRATPYLNLFPAQARTAVGMSPAELRQYVADSKYFEFRLAGKSENRFEVLGLRLCEESLALLTPVTLEQVRKAYWGNTDLKPVLESGKRRGLFYEAEGHLQQGPDPNQLHVFEGNIDGIIADVPELPKLQKIDIGLLSLLEDIEAERINFGLYETFVTIEELAARYTESVQPGQIEALRESLERLRKHFWLFQPEAGYYRSRISEIVRLLKNLKQRFSQNDIASAPYLVHSLQVHFADRKRLKREHSFEAAMRQLFQNHRSEERPHLDSARKAIQLGFSEVIGLPLADVKVTRVQRDSLNEIGSRYLKGDGCGFVITGNTGSGKTEAALMPLLTGALQEKMAGINGCKVLLVYPRQALARNQLERLSHYVAAINSQVQKMRGVSDRGLSIGIAFGDTLKHDQELKGTTKNQDKFTRDPWIQLEGGHVLPYFAAADGSEILAVELENGFCTIRPRDESWKLEGFRATREALQSNPPDVLVITTEMLHRWLGDPQYNALFGLKERPGRAPKFCAPRAIVFDEIHLYDTVHGAQIGLLIRRLRHRLYQALREVDDGWRYPLVIGMSATIGTPETFWKQLSGVPFVQSIVPDPNTDLDDAQGREYHLFIRPETYSRGKHVGSASTAIQTIMAIAHNMFRRAESGKDPAKFRSLIFQDSISKIKKLTVEFRDAERRNQLFRFRTNTPDGTEGLLESPRFAEGEYWYFDREDPFQYSRHRSQPGMAPDMLTSADVPVYSGTGRTALEALEEDIIFATTSLEVGYDDASIQFVLQHHAPRNAASFVQKKGRAGRSLDDRPITAVTLSRHSYRDAFYYQNPRQLYDPEDYRPPLNVENYFVQRFQAIALIFDELARLRRVNLVRAEFPSIESHLEAINNHLQQPQVASMIKSAYEQVIAKSFRHLNPDWRIVWEWFRDRMLQEDIRYKANASNNLFEKCPDLPDKLYSTINLPTVRVMFPPPVYAGQDEGNWDSEDEDIALAFSEIAPGSVTRRYGRKHQLYWRPPYSKNAVERYKKDRQKPGPFNPQLRRQLHEEWGISWNDYLPLKLRQVYGSNLPHHFYRVRYIELWTFGQLDPNNPRETDTKWRGKLLPNGSVQVFSTTGAQKEVPADARRISADSNSYPLSFSVVKPSRPECKQAGARNELPLPPLFPGLVNSLDFYCGEVGEGRSFLEVWEVQYGAEAQVRLVGNSPSQKTEFGYNLVSYKSEHDGSPLLYGYDLQTEGLRVPYNRERLRTLAEEIFEQLWSEPNHRNHLQDQFLRFLIKTERWPLDGLEDPLTNFDLRLVADLLPTMRAESRAGGQEHWQDFLRDLCSPVRLPMLLSGARRYWQDHRALTDKFLARLSAALAHPQVLTFLEKLFVRITTREIIITYLMNVLIHSLQQATRNLFIQQGSTRDEEVGTHCVLEATHGAQPPEDAFYVYERNQDGNGATRLVHLELEQRSPAYLSGEWWDVTLTCSIGDEEDFLKTTLRNHAEALVAVSKTFLATPARNRKSPKEQLIEILGHQVRENDPKLSQLAGLVTSEVRILGEQRPRIAIQCELQRLEGNLAERFCRLPLPNELAGYAAAEVLRAPGEFPNLAWLRTMYEQHSAQLGGKDDDPDDTALPLDRFLAQIEHLSLSTCNGACPACLAAGVGGGSADTARHLLSRRYLKMAHRILTTDLTRPYGSDPDELASVANGSKGFAILEHPGTATTASYDLQLRNQGFQTIMRVLDYETFTVRQVLYRPPAP